MWDGHAASNGIVTEACDLVLYRLELPTRVRVFKAPFHPTPLARHPHGGQARNRVRAEYGGARNCACVGPGDPVLFEAVAAHNGN